MAEAPSVPRSTPQRISRVASVLAVLALAVPWVVWIARSPMFEYSQKFSKVFFPPDGPEDRFQYFRDLVVARGETVRYATCVLCSITVHGQVWQRATAFWGDVTVDGSVGQGVDVIGGSATLLADAQVGGILLSAVGGSVAVDPSAKADRRFIINEPAYFFPGQRSLSARAVLLFAFVMLFAAVCGEWVVVGSFHKRVQAGARRPVSSAFLGVALLSTIFPLLYLATVTFYIFPPLFFLFYLATPVVSWFAFAIGLAALAERLGSLVANTNRVAARLIGAILLLVPMLIPVLGFFVMAVVMLCAIGAGTGVLLWPRSAKERPGLPA